MLDSEIYILSFLICKFQNVPSALDFKVKHSIFSRNFRIIIIYLTFILSGEINYLGQNIKKYIFTKRVYFS